MKRVFVVCTLLLLAACENAILNSIAVSDEPFWLNLGESKVLPPDNIQIGFRQVLSDSRCPLDASVVCVWPGRAEIRLWLRKQQSDSTFVNLSIAGYITQADTCCHLSTDTLGYRITLLQLDFISRAHSYSLADYKALLKAAKVR